MKTHIIWSAVEQHSLASSTKKRNSRWQQTSFLTILHPKSPSEERHVNLFGGSVVIIGGHVVTEVVHLLGEEHAVQHMHDAVSDGGVGVHNLGMVHTHAACNTGRITVCK